ncbi:hypothetical protein FRC12_019084 [Ceratobasidium sp. 428]|nr:hypothetical protein FRC12_019084 [Ceratobasidium sp. 428]
MLPDFLTTRPNKQPSSPRVKLEPAPRVTHLQSPTHVSNITSTATSTASTMSTSTATATSAPAAHPPPGTPRSSKEYITSKMFSQMEEIWKLPAEQREDRFSSALSDLFLGKAAPSPAKRTPGPGKAPMEFDSDPGSDGALGADEGEQSDTPEVNPDIPVQDVEDEGLAHKRGRTGGARGQGRGRGAQGGRGRGRGGGRGGRGGGSKKHGKDEGVIGGFEKDAMVEGNSEGDGDGDGDGGDEVDNTGGCQRRSTRTRSANDAVDKGKAKAKVVPQPNAKAATRAGLRATSKSASTEHGASKSKKK